MKVQRKGVRNHACRNRAGWTLIETSIAVTMTSLLLGILATSMQGIIQLHHTLERDLKIQNAVNRLDHQFRRDVREALICTAVKSSVTIPDKRGERPVTLSVSATTKTDTLLLQMNNQEQILYRSEPRVVHREVIINGERTGIDGFHLPDEVHVRWEIDRRHPHPLIRLTFEDQVNRKLSNHAMALRQVIMAHVGADRHFSKQEHQQ